MAGEKQQEEQSRRSERRQIPGRGRGGQPHKQTWKFHQCPVSLPPQPARPAALLDAARSWPTGTEDAPDNPKVRRIALHAPPRRAGGGMPPPSQRPTGSGRALICRRCRNISAGPHWRRPRARRTREESTPKCGRALRGALPPSARRGGAGGCAPPSPPAGQGRAGRRRNVVLLCRRVSLAPRPPPADPSWGPAGPAPPF